MDAAGRTCTPAHRRRKTQGQSTCYAGLAALTERERPRMSTPPSQDVLSPSLAVSTSHSPSCQKRLVNATHCHACVLGPRARMLL